MPCWKEPFYTFLDGREKVSVGDFLDVLPDVFDMTHTRNFRAKNFQSFEFGMDHFNDDDSYIQKELKRIDEQFDLGPDYKIESSLA